MDQQKLKELLHLQPQEITERTAFCPSGSDLSAHLEGEGTTAGRERLERHLADCSYCRSQVTVLARLVQTEAEASVPDSLFDRASKLGQHPRRRPILHPLRWAAAAVAVLALAAVFTQSPRPGSDPAGDLQSIPGGEPREVRNLDFEYRGPTVLSPADGSLVHPDELTVRWTEVPGSIYYDVRLVNAQGFVLWQDRVKNRSASPPSQLPLVPGDRYFVRVDAYLAEAKRVSSNHVTFIYEGQN